MKFIDLAYKLTHSLKVLTAAGKKPTYLFKKGGSVSSMQIVQSLKQYIPKLDLIIDVGANQGQFAKAAVDQYKDAAIHSFEPLPDVFPILVSNTKNHSNITVHNFALGDSEGEINFFKNEHSHASSILKVSNFQKDVLPETSNQSVINIAIKKLDTVLGDILAKTSGSILLKMDVQGYEKNVLAGAMESVRFIDYILLEVSFVAMYENEPLFNEMNEFLNSLGFSLLAPVGFLQAPNLQIVQLDMLYKRNEDFN